MTEQNNQQVNQILTSIDDKIIAKRKKKKTIISAVILSVVVAISVVIISLACATTNVYPHFLTNANSYDIHIGSSQAYIDEDSNNYQKFLEEYNKIFSSSTLSAMFSGKLSGFTIEEAKNNKETFYSNSKEKTGMSQKLSSMLGSNYIKITFNPEQSITYANGSQYYSNRYIKEKYALKFQDCYLKLDAENADTMTFFVGTYDPVWGNDPTITKITVKASSSALYTSLTELLNI